MTWMLDLKLGKFSRNWLGKIKFDETAKAPDIDDFYIRVFVKNILNERVSIL